MIADKKTSLANIMQSSVAKAVDYCGSHLSCSITIADTHKVVHVNGLIDDDDARQSASVYLVGLIADVIDVSMRIRARLSYETNDHVELLRSVEKLVGSEAKPLSTQTIADSRNPWIAEGISHLCMYIAAIQSQDGQHLASIHPAGRIVGLNRPHVSPKEQGLDTVVLYMQDGQVGLSVVECKAYRDNPNKALSEAVRFFAEIDRGLHDSRIRQVTNAMLDQLSECIKENAPASFWKQHRCYIPNPYYQPDTNWSSRRPVFKKLAVDSQYRLILPFKLSDFDGYFEDISDRMLRFANAVQSEVDGSV